jgi:predicted Zn finger-like uncharacterized protein
MIVTCPVCSTRYLVESSALGVGGRRVRCAHCGHTWHQAPPEDAPLRIDMAPAEPDLFASAAPAETRTELAGETRVQLPMVREERRLPWAGIAWLVLAVVIVGLIAGAVWERDAVVALWPPAARLYAIAGLPVVPPGSGLEIRVTPSRETDNGVPVLVIQGEVVNVSNVARDVPKLRVALRDKDERELQSWTISVTDEPLLPGASAPFRTSVTQPSDAATGIVVTFARASG